MNLALVYSCTVGSYICMLEVSPTLGKYPFLVLTLLTANYQLQLLTSCRIFFPVAVFWTLAANDSVTTVTTQLTVVVGLEEVIEGAAGTGCAVTSSYFTTVSIIFHEVKKIYVDIKAIFGGSNLYLGVIRLHQSHISLSA